MSFSEKGGHVRKPFFPLALFAVASLSLMSWGYEGHYKISSAASLSFNEEMEQFTAWNSVLADHASDADDRKKYDDNEGPKHYIDIDNYPEFIADGKISTSYDSVVTDHGEAFVTDNGTLPWATLAAYDSLKSCFERGDWEKAALTAADLGHYVADGHMPMHVSKNYNGQLTGNNGIHFRYESGMINDHVAEINYDGSPAAFIPDVRTYVFHYLYESYRYVDSVLLADDCAKETAGDTNSALYFNTLWDRTKGFTSQLFRNASHALAELIYTAWVEAGRPHRSMASSPAFTKETGLCLEQNRPNPFLEATVIDYSLPGDSDVLLEVRNLCGITVATIDEGHKRGGSHHIGWSAGEQPAGIYYLVLNTGTELRVRKMIKAGW